MHLNGLKLKFDIVEDGNKAVDQYKAKDGKIDLILMDIHMPDCDGYAATT
jgi:CheY-like chemotaxis protein